MRDRVRRDLMTTRLGPMALLLGLCLAASPLGLSARAESGAPAAAVSVTDQGRTIRTGAFKGSDRTHRARGTASLVLTESGPVLRLKGFEVEPGPGLQVWLLERSPKSATRLATLAKGHYVSLGPLKQVSGDQDYALPAGIEPQLYKAVAIWSEEFSFLFASALLHAP